MSAVTLDHAHDRAHTRADDPQRLRQIFGLYPTGVTALGALIDSRPVGLAASSFTSVSLEPALVSVCIAHSSTTWPTLRTAPRIGVSVLSADHEDACRQLSGRGADRFSGLDWRTTEHGGVVLSDASAWMECGVDQVVRAGDHDIVVLRVHDLEAGDDRPPLVFHASRFWRLER